tara:strand:+ start:457 stop:759 length:303 start_codon:yes stop_codon:yes gene_type:complete
MLSTILVIIGISTVLSVIYYVAWKKGHINDRDKDLIPDEVEDVIEDVKETVEETKRRVEEVKEELKDVVVATKEVIEQSKDVIDAVKGKKRRGRKPKNKK